MGVIGDLIGVLFGGGRNTLRETVEVFRPNAEASAAREAAHEAAALAQFAAEFAHARRGLFDRAVDGLNRLPRPALAFGTIALFVSAMADPVWFASRMHGVALVPDALWWLMGAIVSFYFGARHQMKAQDFQKSIAETLARLPAVTARSTASEVPGTVPQPAEFDPERIDTEGNAALEDWRRSLER